MAIEGRIGYPESSNTTGTMRVLALILAGLAMQRGPVFRAGVEQVAVPVTVKDAKGALIGGLQAGDFRLLEDGVEQQLAGFSSDPAALAAAVVIDAGITRPAAERLRATFPSLAEAFSEFDDVGVFAFDVGVRTVHAFTSDKARFYAALRQLELGADYSQTGEPMSSTAPRINNWPVGGAPARVSSRTPFKNIDDAVLAAARQLEGRDPGRRKIILLISDGYNSPRNKVSTEELLGSLRRSGVAVYSIGLDGAKLNPNSTVLARYGPASGGEFFIAVKKTAIEPLYARITEQARYQYILTYVPARPSTVAPVFRSIEVRVKRPAVNVIARDGYIPEPRAPQP
jgi:VWFA-related protein